MTSLVEFIEARLAEDEQIARDAIDDQRPGTHWTWEFLGDDAYYLRTVEEFPTGSGVGDLPGFPLGFETLVEQHPAMPHIARHDPDRVLREVSAKRAVIDSLRSYITYVENHENGVDIEGELAEVLRPMAAIYSDHPDYDTAWSE